MSAADSLFVLLRHRVAEDGVLAEESILEVTGGMTLGLEKRIEVPERTLDPPVGWHLVEAH